MYIKKLAHTVRLSVDDSLQLELCNRAFTVTEVPDWVIVVYPLMQATYKVKRRYIGTDKMPRLLLQKDVVAMALEILSAIGVVRISSNEFSLDFRGRTRGQLPRQLKDHANSKVDLTSLPAKLQLRTVDEHEQEMEDLEGLKKERWYKPFLDQLDFHSTDREARYRVMFLLACLREPQPSSSLWCRVMEPVFGDADISQGSSYSLLPRTYLQDEIKI